MFPIYANLQTEETKRNIPKTFRFPKNSQVQQWGNSKRTRQLKITNLSHDLSVDCRWFLAYRNNQWWILLERKQPLLFPNSNTVTHYWIVIFLNKEEERIYVNRNDKNISEVTVPKVTLFNILTWYLW